MSELQVIETALAKAARRRRRVRAMQGFGWGALVGGLVMLLAVGAYKLFPIPERVILWAGVAAGVGALVSAVLAAWRRPGALEIARWVDERKHFKDRLSTALEMAPGATSGDWKQLLLADAARHAQGLDARELFPFRLPKAARWALAVLVMAAGLGFVPEYRSKAAVEKQKDAVVIKDVGKQLNELMRRELAQRPPTLAPTQKSMEQVAELGEKLAKASLTKTEALRDLASVTEKIAQQERELGQKPMLKQMERAAREPGNGASATPQSLQKQVEELQKALGDAAGQGEKLDKMGKELQNLQQQAANMAGKESKGGSAAREQLMQNLADLARAAKEAGADLDALEEAIEALKANDTDQFIRDLEMASHDLEKMRDMAKAMQSLKQQMGKMGKDLAEQLQKGQAQAAMQTLEKMIEQLRQSGNSPEQMQKLVEEVTKAIAPAKEYGKAAEHLQDAAGEGQQGDKPAAAQSLAAARDELKKLLDQMADSEAMEGMLDALARADKAMRSGKMWSQCQGSPCGSCEGAGCGQCNGTGRNWGKGGRPGRGVGTWAEENGWTYFDADQDAGWDNTGIQRPDMDGRAPTDRPTDLNPNLIPDKVKGQMSPGGSMPSITLKGVSIKGTSKVQFEEAATAAQEEAQNALNQDKVPRAYQNTVKEYFDDLKKKEKE